MTSISLDRDQCIPLGEARREGWDLDIQSTCHASVNAKIVRIQHHQFDTDEVDPTIQQTPHRDPRRATVMKYWSYSPSHHGVIIVFLDNIPPHRTSSHLPIILQPALPNLKTPIHTTQHIARAASRPSSTITKAKMPPCLS